MLRSQRQRALVEAGIALAAELDLDAILSKLVRTAADLADAQYAALGVLSRDGTYLERFITHGMSEDQRAAIGDSPRGKGILGVLIKDARPLRLSDLAADPRAVGMPEHHPPMHSFLGLPILLRGVAFGNLYLTEKRGGIDFSDDDLEVTTLLAAQAAVAIGNARRIERDVLARVVSAQEVERRRLARELHDGTGQALTSFLLGLSAVEHADSLESVRRAVAPLRELVVATLQDVRRLSVELRPKALDDFGLGPALRRLGESVRETTGVNVQVEERLGAQRLPADVETAVYRIVQEALTNALRHADAERVSIVAIRRAGSISLVIEDDGRGFDAMAPADGMGLSGMRERVSLLDGLLRLDSSPGAGTTLVVDLPAPDRDPTVTRILIVDDHAVVRLGLRLLLERESDFEVVGEAGNADEGVRMARLEKPDLVLLDVVMPGRSGLEVAAEIRDAAKGARVLILSMQDDPTYVREAFAAGASGYLLKEAADTELVAAIREVASGGRYVHPTLGARLAQAEVDAARRAADDPLSDREREVLRLLALGHTNQEIAKQLFISVRTAETHRAHIMQKLGLGTRAELVRYAIANGLLDEA